MPNIEITDFDFGRLQKLATPFIDTPATTVAKVLDFFEANCSASSTPLRQPTQSTVEYFEHLLPPLVHTKVLDANLGGEKPERMTWDAVVRLSLNTVIRKLGTPRELYKISGANVVEGKKDTEGYKPVPENGYSYQGVSAEDAVKIIARCARYLRTTVRIEFEWRNKKDAHRPGERGILILGR
jgi:hypothetical protein